MAPFVLRHRLILEEGADAHRGAQVRGGRDPAAEARAGRRLAG